ncbi:hypothetical protein PHYBOEH_007423 [Phytophthora boehmeriae]|uniref:KIF-binding protein n=1 Tax=Phytophthora boehmeriae TaxID=109152 RepID=A0A8T1W9T9_9STRA|nr:hypothetical protein PHYBOEH_007423 [Phytophthora boehmeriae]
MSDLPEDFHALLRRLEDIGAEEVPEATPYAAYYRVIEILQKLRTTNMSPAENACAAAKLGATYLLVEEPHHAQPALEEAGKFFFPELVTFAAAITADDGAPDQAAAKEVAPKLLAERPHVNISPEHEAYLAYVVELLNQLGVLWSNRSRALRALCYLSAGLDLSEKNQDEALASKTYTHFYLAQVYSALGMADESAKFCLSTLELQLLQCANNAESGDSSRFAGAHEWVRNALKLVEFYLDTENPKDAATCLKASEYMLLHHGTEAGEKDEDQEMLVAEIYSKWSQLHALTLQLAEMKKEGYAIPESASVLPCPSSMEATLVKLSQGAFSEAKQISADKASEGETSGFGMEFEPAAGIETFDQARDVFKMGLLACTRARRVFVLDGFVTQHVRLLQRESTLYRRLLAFEDARGRRVAMQRRRLALLSPMLGDTLNERAFGDLLQELYFECAEVNADIFELKKSKEAGEKALAYELKAIHCYQQFLLLYYPPLDATAADRNDPRRTAVLLGGKQVQLPPGEPMTPKEFRTLLLGYFGLAHACGKIVLPSETSKTVGYWKQSLAYHEAVIELVQQYEQQQKPQGLELRRIFGAELTICTEMIELLPEKINQLVYNGKAL